MSVHFPLRDPRFLFRNVAARQQRQQRRQLGKPKQDERERHYHGVVASDAMDCVNVMFPAMPDIAAWLAII